MSYVVQNPGGNAIRFSLFNEIHNGNILRVVVLPANAPDEGEEDTPGDVGKDRRRRNVIEEGPSYWGPASLSGTWKVGNGWVYAITQEGSTFTWTMEALDEKGKGTIEGTNVSATWSGKNGSGSATGTMVLDAGVPIKIQWSNGIVFTRD
jgi:hypothetical protein